ncbi:NUDIX hydrolase [Haladaptatus salinisoli]|uniref:NUDIX hydrolase n=1 Tax=Haladaptatus salinisoli TaxID=2884876 RepID=UPI001D0A4161|nr:NUDIX domain-containing protein [Haladaptatus salinisoli]
MRRDSIRPKAFCVVERDGEILVHAHEDPKTGERYYRPLGGGIEFGEHSRAAVVREFREEVGAELVEVVRLGVLENLFSYDGRLGHELVVVYDGAFADESLYEKDALECYEDAFDERFEAFWKPIDDFRGETGPLYPEGLLELLVERE